MSKTVVIDGEIELLQVVDGDLSLNIVESGEFGEFIALRDLVYPIYEGATEIVPTNEEQVLDTTFKTTTADIVIKPIPSNYGLVTWDGSILMVS